MPQLAEDEKTGTLEKSLRRAKRDGDLQISRRLDWRFLLPNPHLRHVALVGPGGGTLLAALNQFCDSLTILSPPCREAAAQGDHFPFSLVVVCSRAWSDIRAASSVLAAGGWLYWEIDRRKRFPSFRRIAGGESVEKPRGLGIFRDYIRVLEGLGFCDIEVYGQYPNFEECRAIIPLNDQSAVAYVLSRGRRGFARQITSAAGRYLAKSRLLARLAPCISVVARKRMEAATAS